LITPPDQLQNNQNNQNKRYLFGIAALIALVALAIQLLNWFRSGVLNIPALVNMAGLLILTLTGFFDPPSRKTRQQLNLLAIALIISSALFIVLSKTSTG
jgi:hypothetical protein